MKKLKKFIPVFFIATLSLSLLTEIEPHGDREPPIAMIKDNSINNIY